MDTSEAGDGESDASSGAREWLKRRKQSLDLAVAMITALKYLGPALPILLLVLGAVSSGLGLVQPVVTGLIVGRIPDAVGRGIQSASGQRLLVDLAIFGAIFVGGVIVSGVNEVVSHHAQYRIDGEVRRRLRAASLGPAGISHLESSDALDEIHLVSQPAFGISIGTATTHFVSTFFRYARVVGAVAILARFSLLFAGAILLLVLAARSKFRFQYFGMGEAWGEQMPQFRRADYTKGLAGGAVAAKENRVFAAGQWLIDRYENQWHGGMEPLWKLRRDTMWSILILCGSLAVVYSLMYALLVRAAMRGDITIGELTAYMGVSAQTLSGSYIGDAGFHYVKRPIEALRSIETRRDATRAMNFTPAPAGSPQQQIAFEGVDFTYPGSDHQVFSSLDLTINAGQSMAIVGLNGAGKTTFVKLIAQLYLPTRGRITVDGVDLADLDPDSWRRRLGFIFQDFVQYPLSAADNVGFGHVEDRTSESSLKKAAAQAGVLSRIESLPDGWDTPLSRKVTDGADLSGGEWQRVALARALFAIEGGAGVLVLDEPTANLDARGEAELFDRFLELTGGLTTILISHRFSTVRHAERIVVLGEGRVVEDGTHEELLARGGPYAEMFLLQAAQFTDDGEANVESPA